MPDVKLTDARRIAILTEQVRGTIEPLLLRVGPIDQNNLRDQLKNRGLEIDNADLLAIRDTLIADGTIEIVP